MPTVSYPVLGGPVYLGPVSESPVSAFDQPGSLQILVQPSPAGLSGVQLAVQPVINVLTPRAGVIEGTYAGPVLAAIATGAGVLSGTNPVNAVLGVATFTNLTITGASTDTLIFTTPGSKPLHIPATSNSITIT